MTTQTQQQPQPERPKKVIVLISNGKNTVINPEWKLIKGCCNCSGRGCVLCSFKGEYHD